MGLLLIESSSDHTFCSSGVSISKKQVVILVTRIHPETSGGRLIFSKQQQMGSVPVENQVLTLYLSLKHKQLQDSWSSKGGRHQCLHFAALACSDCGHACAAAAVKPGKFQ